MSNVTNVANVVEDLASEVKVSIVLASSLSPRIAREVEEIAPLLALAKLDHVHVLRIEVREGSEGARMRMRCDCSRSSYFASATNASEIPSSVVVALSRHVARAQGKALRVVKSSPSLLASYLGREDASEAREDVVSRDVASASEAPEDASDVSRVRGAKGAIAHLTRDALTTLCGKDASDMSEDASDDAHATCRACDKVASA